MAPPAGAAAVGGAAAAVVGDGGAAGEGLMDNLEDILEGAVSGEVRVVLAGTVTVLV